MRDNPNLSVGEVVLKSAEYLAARGVDSPRLDAELLLCHVMGCDRLRLYLDWQKPLLDMELAACREAIRQRGVERIPVARIVGRKEFYGRNFTVSRATFVPRPETEGLVDRCLDLFAREPVFATAAPNVFEVGTGTGAIAVSLAAEIPHAVVHASDVSAEAIATASQNARNLGVGHRVDFRIGSCLAGYGGAIHLLVSNPPYIPSGEIPGLAPEVRTHDPAPALDGGGDGLDVIRQIVAAATLHLVDGGWVALEIGEGQGADCAAEFAATGLFETARVERDPAGHERYVLARRVIGS